MTNSDNIFTGTRKITNNKKSLKKNKSKNKSNDLDKDNKKLSKIIKLNKFTQIFHSFFKRIYRDI